MNYVDTKNWRTRNPLKIRAHRKVYGALRNGSLKKEKCFCGERKVEAHHENYEQPLKVVWLCKKHHRLADKLRRVPLLVIEEQEILTGDILELD